MRTYFDVVVSRGGTLHGVSVATEYDALTIADHFVAEGCDVECYEKVITTVEESIDEISGQGL